MMAPDGTFWKFNMRSSNPNMKTVCKAEHCKRVPDVVDDTLEILVVDCDVINIHSWNVEATNGQQASTVTYLQQLL